MPTKGRLCQVHQPACAKQLAVSSRLCLAVPSTGAAWHGHPPVLTWHSPGHTDRHPPSELKGCSRGCAQQQTIDRCCPPHSQYPCCARPAAWRQAPQPARVGGLAVRGANRRQRQKTVCKNRIVIIAIQEPILGEPPPARSMGGRPAGQGPPAQVESCLPPPERSNADEMVKRRHSRQGLAAGTVKRRRNGQTPKKWSNADTVDRGWPPWRPQGVRLRR